MNQSQAWPEISIGEARYLWSEVPVLGGTVCLPGAAGALAAAAAERIETAPD